jgi:uncharacterized protein YbjT (DUF2867 family)
MIAVTGANGYLGKLVIEGLLERVPSDQIIAAARSPEKAFSFGTLGMQVREADYTRPETLSLALHGVKKLLLISARCVIFQIPAISKNHEGQARSPNVLFRLLVFSSEEQLRTVGAKQTGIHKQLHPGVLGRVNYCFVLLESLIDLG